MRRFSLVAIWIALILAWGMACSPKAGAPRGPAGNPAALKPELAPVENVPGLPRVLILGDSISIGYTLPLRAALEGIANIHRPTEGCGHTAKGLENLEKWLGDGRWDVIHFNFGLHDLKHTAHGKLVMPPGGERVTPLDEYARNLDEIVNRLARTGARLIWRPTTPVPEGALGRIAGDEEKYNTLAAEVMVRHGVAIDDLNPLIREGKVERTASDNVHFTKKGSRILARRIAYTIERELGDHSSPPPPRMR